MEQNPVSVETTFCPLTVNEDIAFRDPRLALDGHVQFTSSEADRIGGLLSSTSMMSHSRRSS